MFEEKNFPCSHGSQTRDFIYISDAINFIYKIMINKDVGIIINLGSGKRIKVKKIIKYIVKICKGGFPNFGQIKLRNDEQLNLYPSVSFS